MKIVVIGGGPGGYVAAIRAAQLGAEVTLIERDRMGGTCLNVGCIPTKALLRTAELLTEARDAAKHGVIATPVLDFPAAQAAKTAVVDKLVGGVEGLMKVNKVRVVRASARFTGPKSLVADGEDVPFDKVIIASGSVPAMPPIPGADGPACVDSTGALAFDSPPERLVIVGGGVIGVELASIYAAMGTQVSIVEMLDEILPPMDRELAAALRAKLVGAGLSIRTGATVLRIEPRGAGASVMVKDGDATLALEADKVLVAVGRRANTEGLGLDAAGVTLDRGCIEVDAGQRTNVEGIYAIGDCTGGAMLAHVASAQGEVAAENAMGGAASYDGRTNPSCVYTNPELAGVGLTEEQARAGRGDGVRVGRFPLAANGKALILGGEGMVKVIADAEFGKILGVHIFGPRATDLIAEAAVAIGAEATLDDVAAVIHAHPTVAEAVREAVLATLGRAIHVRNPRARKA